MAILVQSNKKPSVTFPSQTGSIVTFNSQYAGLPLKSCKVNIPVTQEGTGDPSLTNVRNFVGVDSLDFSATGKNLLRPNRSSATVDGVTYTVNEDFSITTSGEYQGQSSIFIASYLVTLRAGTYILTGCPSGGSYSDYVLRIENSQAQRIALDTGNGNVFTLTKDQPVICRIYVYSQNGVGKTFYPMVRMVDSDPAYEPFGDNKLFTFGQTIYAGELDVLTGELKATHKLAIFDGSESWVKSSSYSGSYFLVNWVQNNSISRSTDHLQNIGTTVDNLTDYSAGANVCFFEYSLNYKVNGDLYPTVEDFKNFLSQNNLQLLYPLPTAEVINLGGMEISTLQGENNLFASVGETTVQYIKIGG